MPTFLVHGFRWDRISIRIHIVLHDLDDAAPEWIVAPATSIALLNSFYALYDFLPPSTPPPLPPPCAHPPLPAWPTASPAGQPTRAEDEAARGTRRLKAGRSFKNLREMVRRPKSSGGALTAREREACAAVNGSGNGNENGNGKGPGHGPGGNGNGDARRKGSDAESRTTRSSGGRSTPATNPEPDKYNRNKEKDKTNSKTPAFNDWSVVKLLEQHDPEDMVCTSQPHAYVADYVVEVPLGVSITDAMALYEAKLKEEEEEEEESALRAPGTSEIPAVPPLPYATAVSGNGGLLSPPPSAGEPPRRARRGWFPKLRDQLQKDASIGWHVVVCGDEERLAPSVIEEQDDDDDDGGGGGGGDGQSYQEEGKQKRPKSAGLKGFFGKK